MSINEDKCLEIIDWQDPFGKTITMNFYSEKGLIDLNPFFQNFFEERNRFFGLEKKFWKQYKNLTEYQFSLSDFAESFLGIYSGEEIGNFLENLLIENDLSENFIDEIKTMEKENKIIFPIYLRRDREKGRLYFSSQNLKINELNRYLKIFCKGLPKSQHKDLRYPYLRKDLFPERTDFSNPMFYEHFHKPNIQELREGLLSSRPKIIICPATGFAPKLDYLSLISKYNLPYEHLKVVRKL